MPMPRMRSTPPSCTAAVIGRLADAWPRLGAQCGVTLDGDRPAFTFDMFSQIVEAAERGLGAGLVPRFVAAHAQSHGRLVVCEGLECRLDGGYHLVYRAQMRYDPTFPRFKEWLLSQARAIGAL